jgi:hypothetical protein
MNSFEDAMAIMGCADTESGAYDNASAAFEEASSQLEELGFDYEITSEGVSFSRSGTAVGEYDPATRIGAAPFLGLTGISGSADQRISGGWCSHGGAEARREQREESATRPGGQLACLVLLPVC